MSKFLKFIIFVFAVTMTIFACKKSTSLTPEMWLVDASHVMFEGKQVEISDIANTMRDYKARLDPSIQDSVQIRFVLEQGIDMVVLEQVKIELQNGGILDLKFVAPWDE